MYKKLFQVSTIVLCFCASLSLGNTCANAIKITPPTSQEIVSGYGSMIRVSGKERLSCTVEKDGHKWTGSILWSKRRDEEHKDYKSVLGPMELDQYGVGGGPVTRLTASYRVGNGSFKEDYETHILMVLEPVSFASCSLDKTNKSWDCTEQASKTTH